LPFKDFAFLTLQIRKVCQNDKLFSSILAEVEKEKSINHKDHKGISQRSQVITAAL
jgi:hypothetical protein